MDRGTYFIALRRIVCRSEVAVSVVGRSCFGMDG